ncbi:MAG: asparaginase [Ilumatobacteraceae bacterium]
MSWSEAFVPLAVTTRSGFDESVHHGAVVVIAGGEVAHSAGDIDVEIYPRSSNKPMQADAMVRFGLGVDDEQLALACASHDGTERHLAVVRSVLADAGLDETALDNTPSLPLDECAAETVVASGGQRSSILMNCSGKHAAMVATCRSNGWPVVGYLEPAHPLQQAITDRIEALAGPVVHIGVDGCGAPAHVLRLRRLADAFATLAAARGPVWRAMTGYPDLVGGDRRVVTRVMRAIPGAMAKDGAQGVFAIAHPDGWAVAIKIADGQERPVPVVLATALARIGVDLDGEAISEPVLGHGRPVGRVRSLT